MPRRLVLVLALFGIAQGSACSCEDDADVIALRPALEVRPALVTIRELLEGTAERHVIEVVNVGPVDVRVALNDLPLEDGIVRLEAELPGDLVRSGLALPFDVDVTGLSPGTSVIELVVTGDGADPVVATFDVEVLPPCTEGEACDDGNACTMGDVCFQRRCRGQGVLCEQPESPCLQSVCDPLQGCVELDDPTYCDDGDPCTVGLCEAGECLQLPAEEGTPCGSRSGCDPLLLCFEGQCGAFDVPEGFPCSDEDACTVGDTCQSGACVGVFEPQPAEVLHQLHAWGTRRAKASALSSSKVVVLDPHATSSGSTGNGPAVLTVVGLSEGNPIEGHATIEQQLPLLDGFWYDTRPVVVHENMFGLFGLTGDPGDDDTQESITFFVDEGSGFVEAGTVAGVRGWDWSTAWAFHDETQLLFVASFDTGNWDSGMDTSTLVGIDVTDPHQPVEVHRSILPGLVGALAVLDDGRLHWEGRVGVEGDGDYLQRITWWVEPSGPVQPIEATDQEHGRDGFDCATFTERYLVRGGAADGPLRIVDPSTLDVLEELPASGGGWAMRGCRHLGDDRLLLARHSTEPGDIKTDLEIWQIDPEAGSFLIMNEPQNRKIDPAYDFDFGGAFGLAIIPSRGSGEWVRPLRIASLGDGELYDYTGPGHGELGRLLEGEDGRLLSLSSTGFQEIATAASGEPLFTRGRASRLLAGFFDLFELLDDDDGRFYVGIHREGRTNRYPEEAHWLIAWGAALGAASANVPARAVRMQSDGDRFYGCLAPSADDNLLGAIVLQPGVTDGAYTLQEVARFTVPLGGSDLPSYNLWDFCQVAVDEAGGRVALSVREVGANAGHHLMVLDSAADPPVLIADRGIDQPVRSIDLRGDRLIVQTDVRLEVFEIDNGAMTFVEPLGLDHGGFGRFIGGHGDERFFGRAGALEFFRVTSGPPATPALILDGELEFATYPASAIRRGDEVWAASPETLFVVRPPCIDATP